MKAQSNGLDLNLIKTLLSCHAASGAACSRYPSLCCSAQCTCIQILYIDTPFSCCALCTSKYVSCIHIFTLSLIVIPPSPRSLHVHTYTYIIPPPFSCSTLCACIIQTGLYIPPPHNVHHMQGIIPTSPSPTDHCHLILKLKLRCC